MLVYRITIGLLVCLVCLESSYAIVTPLEQTIYEPNANDKQVVLKSSAVENEIVIASALNPCRFIFHFAGSSEEMVGSEIIDLVNILVMDGFTQSLSLAYTSSATNSGNGVYTNNRIGYIHPTRGLSKSMMEKFSKTFTTLEQRMVVVNPWTAGWPANSRIYDQGGRQVFATRKYMLVKINMKTEKEDEEWIVDMTSTSKYSWP